MKKNILIGLAILVLFGGLGYLKYTNEQSKEQTNQINQTQEVNSNSATASTENAKLSIQQKSSISIKNDPPINGIYKGVIEVGASGFNAFIINIDKEKNWELVSKHFGKSLAWEGFANADDIYNQTKDYIGEMAEKGVAGRNIHFVMSSGALKAKGIDKVKQAIQAKGFVVNAVTADQEGKFALKALLPKDYKNNSFIVDIGSGNTKISWYEGQNLRTLECSGAKYFSDGKTDLDVYNEVTTAVSKVPSELRQNCFMIGGVPYKLAKEVRNGEERYTLLNDPDSYSAGDDIKLKSGINIYRALKDGSKTDNFIFDWDANFTIGFLLSLN